MTDRRIPVTVVTGFLGSGKSTVLNHLLRQPELSGTAVIVNEFGSVGIDHHLVEKIADDIVLLDSGCLCCAVHGDLVRSLRSLFMRALRREVKGLRRVVIETSGLADVAPLVHTLLRDFFIAERYVLDGIVTTVDACHIQRQLTESDEAVRQVAMADVLLLTKLDLSASASRHSLRQQLAAINPAAEIAEGVHGAVAAELVLHRGAYRPETGGEEVARWLDHPVSADTPTNHDHAHDARVHSFALTLDGPIRWADFAAAMERLQATHGERLLRMKGIIEVVGEDRPLVVHAVHHQLYPALPLQEAGKAPLGRLVFIVRELSRKAVEEVFGL